jgi:hypothetical protein
MLVDRDYYLKEEVGCQEGAKEFIHRPYRYAVGQPMGALSSWAMLAVTHHLILQLAYRLAYPEGIIKD